MIRTETEYQEAMRRFKQDTDMIDVQKARLAEANLGDEQIVAALEPSHAFHAQLSEEITWYENVCRGRFAAVKRLTDIGRLLIALRIYSGMTQKALADRLGVSEAQVSRDERNEYHGITIDKAQRVLDALHASLTTTVDDVATSRLTTKEDRVCA